MELDPNWVVGFVDGEGRFYVGVQKHPEMTAGFQVLPEFVVVQHQRDIQVLYALKRFFGCGVVRRSHDDRFALRIRNLKGLESVCDFFAKHPLKTRKRVDSQKFRKIVALMKQRRHLNREGLGKIIDIALSMNTARRPALERVRSALDDVG